MFLEQTIVQSYPGVRFPALEHLKRLACWVQEELSLETQVMSNATGSFFRHHMLTTLENLDQQVGHNIEILGGEFFQDWFKNSTQMIDWPAAEMHILEIHRSASIQKPGKFLAAAYMRLLPGKRFAGLEHLKELAKYVEQEYESPTTILSPISGDLYVTFMGMQFESMGKYQESMARLTKDENYGAWFTEALPLINVDKLGFNLFHRHL